MSDRELAIKVLKELPNNITMKEIIETLNNIFDLKYKIKNIDENEGIDSEELKNKK